MCMLLNVKQCVAADIQFVQIEGAHNSFVWCCALFSVLIQVEFLSSAEPRRMIQIVWMLLWRADMSAGWFSSHTCDEGSHICHRWGFFVLDNALGKM